MRQILIVAIFNIAMASCEVRVEKESPNIVSTTKILLHDDMYRIVGRDSDNRILMFSHVNNQKLDSAYFEFYKSGLIKKEAFYRAGKKDGEEVSYFDSLKSESSAGFVNPMDFISASPQTYSFYNEGKPVHRIEYNKDGGIIKEEGTRFVRGNYLRNSFITCDSTGKRHLWYRIAYPPKVNIRAKKIQFYDGLREAKKIYTILYGDTDLVIEDSINCTQQKTNYYIIEFEGDDGSKSEDTLIVKVKGMPQH